MNLAARFQRRGRLLIVTAVDAERQAVQAGLATAGISVDDDRVVVRAGGVGPAAAAAATGAALAAIEILGLPFVAVISAGIGGGVPGRAEVGATVLASRSVAADLGAEAPEGFIPLTELGFGPSTVDADATLLDALRAALPQASVGEVLTVSTVTGTADRAEVLRQRHPHALAEAMEGFGVATAAQQNQVAFAEVRTISNPVGPRDRSAWRIDLALAALEEAAKGLASLAV